MYESIGRIAQRILGGVRPDRPIKPREYWLELSFDSEGFTVSSLKGKTKKSASCSWKEIVRATAFKRDLLTSDCVCLFLQTQKEMGIEVDEEMKGWSEFIEALPSQLSGCKAWSEWFMAVAHPAFATNETEIYSRIQDL